MNAYSVRLRVRASGSTLLRWLLLTTLVLCTAGTSYTWAQGGDCSRVVGKWRCRKCGWLNPEKAKFCRRDHADLTVQQREFKNALSLMILPERRRLIRGESTKLSWYVHCAERVTIDPDVGQVGLYGLVRIRPSTSTTYTLRVESQWSDWAVDRKDVTVEVLPAMLEARLEALPLRVWPGDRITLVWKTKNASRVLLEPSGLEVSPEGKITVPVVETTTFKLDAQAEGVPSVQAEARVEVLPRPQPPVLPKTPDFAAIFAKASPRIHFAHNEPNPGDPRKNALTAPQREELGIFSKFLREHSEVHFKVVAAAFEWFPYSGSKGNVNRHRQLLLNRRALVLSYLIQQGISEDRISGSYENSLVSVSPPSVKGDKLKEQEAQAVYFEYAGVKPTLAVLLEPRSVRADELAILAWDSQNADEVWIKPDIGRREPRGTTQVQPGWTTSYTISASNSYGYSVSQILKLEVRPIPASPSPPPPPTLQELFQENVNDVFFGHGSSALGPEAEKTLDQLAVWLLQPGQRIIRIQLTGSTDGSEALTVGHQRAERCRQYLIRAGIAPARMSLASPQRIPFDDREKDNNPYAGRALNRRVRIEMKHPR